METLMIVVAGVFVTAATYLMLSGNVIRIILGTAMFTHAAHLLLITMGGLGASQVPIIDKSGVDYADALPQALILTSIVITFGVTAFFLVLAYRTFKETGTDHIDRMRGIYDE
ncbi:Na(+)/H(+) antiporter subunit C [Virgibacillus sp. W0181]|uniref:Na(+)/H(+) antiporter subunit C n=1 Tax=Virgibacillus sp. W0181 TaxID=3391581 RepID=UPI003F474140